MLGKEISAKELLSVLDNAEPSAVLVDVRTPAEFLNASISGAINIPVDQIPVRGKELARYQKIYLYCLSGSRSQLAAALLGALLPNAEFYSLTSGLLAWRKEGFVLANTGKM